MKSKVKDSGSGRNKSIIAVAKVAQVSTATVSRVLNNLGNVKPSLELRVRKAINEVGYHPNVAARALKSGRSRIFGVLISDLRNPFFPELLQGFEESAIALGYEVLVASTAYEQQRMSVCIDRMLERNVDGVALMTFGIEGTLLGRFADRGVPMVAMDQAPVGRNTHAIQVDYEIGLHEAIQHLAVLGHRQIGFVTGPKHQISVENRRRAMKRAMRSVGLMMEPDLTFQGDHTLVSGHRALESFLKLKHPPTAIVCSNDLTAFGIMQAADTVGISIPDDLSLVGFDGIEMGAAMVPPLTSVCMSGSEIARAAVNALYQMVERKEALSAPIKTKLLIRRSTSTPRGSLTDLRPDSPILETWREGTHSNAGAAIRREPPRYK